MTAERPPTHDEIQRVRRFDCSVRGHSFDVVMVMGSSDPQIIVCHNCGETWNVGPSESAPEEVL